MYDKSEYLIKDNFLLGCGFLREIRQYILTLEIELSILKDNIRRCLVGPRGKIYRRITNLCNSIDKQFHRGEIGLLVLWFNFQRRNCTYWLSSY